MGKIVNVFVSNIISCNCLYLYDYVYILYLCTIIINTYSDECRRENIITEVNSLNKSVVEKLRLIEQLEENQKNYFLYY